MRPIRRVFAVLALTAAAVLVPAAAASADPVVVDDSAWGTPPVDPTGLVGTVGDVVDLIARPLDSAWG